MSFAAVVALIAGWESAAPWRRRLHERAEVCRFRRKPATYSDLIAATLPI
jgi:hypothetical protein